MKLGAHMPISGGVWQALVHGRRIGCECVQLFLKNNLQWATKPYSPETINRFNLERSLSQFSHVFAHAGYLINLAAPASPKRDRAIQALIQEIELAAALHLPFVVLHPGAHLGRGEAAGVRQVVAGLNDVLSAVRQLAVRIALETTAGQGTCIGYKLEHLAAIFDGVRQPGSLTLCIDTAHVFAAGYDIRTRQGWDNLLQQLDSLIGLDKVVAIHLNDSKAPLGSRVDRHAHIGKGALGTPAFRHVVNDPRFRDHPGCIETPKSPDLHEDIRNLAVLRSLLNLQHG